MAYLAPTVQLTLPPRSFLIPALVVMVVAVLLVIPPLAKPLLLTNCLPNKALLGNS